MPEDKGLSRSGREQIVLQFWKDNKIFEKSLEKNPPAGGSGGNFVFYEGPPTANGKPAIHHLEARAFKDAILRYKTMRGFRVNRKAGWDTHGLPVEIEAEKTLGLKSKKEIEEYGVEKFNAECKRSVGQYIDLWKTFTDRVGYWVNMDKAYFTYHNSYIEAVWGIMAFVEKRKLLYKDYRVVPWCPRCGTALSSHELAQGYEEVKDLSLYTKFKIVGFPDAYFLAWTTTPWTLPGNVALAVGPKIVYVEAKVGKEILVLAKERLSIIKESYKIIAEHKGSEMVGMAYEPVYPFVKDESGKAFKIYPADFVTTVDGTGIVHTAVMYGQEDFDLGTKVGLPKVHLVSPDGTFMKGTGWLEGRSVVDENLSVDILKDLKDRGLLFDKENYTHSYPFCWRCGTRLIYYARDSWYIEMSKLRDELVKENEKINWEPDYIKEGRFGDWLREVKDWAISRERYWGTPLPVWMPASTTGGSEDGDRIVVDSIEMLKKYSKKSGNKYFAMRHGEAEQNVKNICDSTVSNEYHITNKGIKRANEAAKKLKKEKIDLIISSPFVRTRETAEIIAEQVGLDKKDIVVDERLFEIRWGDFEGGPYPDYLAYEEKKMKTYDHHLPNGESYQDVKNRVGEFLYEIDSKYKDKNILLVSHGILLEVLPAIAEGADKVRSKEIIDKLMVKTGELIECDFVRLPHNKDFELDLHKPFIDEIVLEKNGKEYRRVKEVMDVWFDSGSVPFAQDPQKVVYPADFISEALDQTRGWFYSMHAVGVLMEGGRAFKNVICLGLLMDNTGKKMSKSMGNVVDPFEMIEKYGVDTLRMWMYSVNQAGESKNFDEKSVEEINRKIFNLLDNVYAFYELYANGEKIGSADSKNILDQWIVSRLAELTNTMTTKLDLYKLLEPTRALREFIDDLSTWYLRRSRDRLKEGDKEARETLYFALKTLSKLIAPFAPFYAEDLHRKLRTKSCLESVHLEEWPKAGKVDEKLIKNMNRTREIVSLALEARSKANLKVRQPLASATVKLDGAYLDLINDEVNVKKVIDKDTEGVELDTNITPELAEEGKVRDLIRAIQEMRKEKNLKPTDKMDYSIIESEREIFEKNKKQIEDTTNVKFV